MEGKGPELQGSELWEGAVLGPGTGEPLLT